VEGLIVCPISVKTGWKRSWCTITGRSQGAYANAKERLKS
jgi:hypothetical protein